MLLYGVIMLGFIMLSVIMLSVIILSVVFLSLWRYLFYLNSSAEWLFNYLK